jgi:hypothetical protein
MQWTAPGCGKVLGQPGHTIVDPIITRVGCGEGPDQPATITKGRIAPRVPQSSISAICRQMLWQGAEPADATAGCRKVPGQPTEVTNEIATHCAGPANEQPTLRLGSKTRDVAQG